MGSDVQAESKFWKKLWAIKTPGKMAKRRRRQGPSHSTLATPPCAGDIKNNEVPPAQRNKKNDSEVPPAERKKTIDEASAMLLYEAPSGIAIFCFDGEYLEKPVKDFWSALPQLSLEFFLKYKRVSTPFDLDNGTVDNFLAKRLTKLCGTKKKLAVGGAEHTKGIIDAKLGITCLYVGVPDCEVISCLKNPNRTLLPEEKSETWGRNCLRSGKELVKFSHHYEFQVKPEVVNESIVELTGLLHGIELREMEHLKFLRILLKDFLILSGIGTNWSLIELATLLKMICYREASYEGSCPVQIFSSDEYQKIEVNASQYKTSFSRIDVLSVYEDVISLDIAKDILLLKLDILVNKEIPEKAEVTILPTGVKVGKEGNSNVDDRLNSIAEDNCSEVTLVDGKLDFSSERPLVDANQIRTISDEHSSMEKPNINEEIYNKEDANCLIPDKIPEKLSANRDGVERKAGLQTRDDYGQKLTASAVGLLGIKKDEHTNTSVKETNLHGKFADDEKNKQPRGTQGIPDTSMSSKSERHNQKDVIPATSEVPKSGPLKDLNGDGKKKTASTPGGLGKQDEHTDSSNPVGENKGNKQARDTDVQSMDDCAKKQTASALGNKKDENTNTSVKETNLHGKFGDDEKKSSPEVLKGFLTES